MNRDQSKGNFDQLKGKVKEAWGRATRNEATQAEGKSDRMAGKIRETVGDVKELFRPDNDIDPRRRAEEREREIRARRRDEF